MRTATTFLALIILNVADTLERLSPRMLDFYVELCGSETTCSYRSEDNADIPSTPLRECPKCHCDAWPGELQCPDMATHRCLDRIILSASSTQKGVYSSIAHDTCSGTTDSSLKDLCFNESFDILNSDSYPYQAYWFKLYRNKHCAVCNNVTVSDDKRISLAVTQCEQNTFDINVYRSIAEIQETLTMSKCNLRFDLNYDGEICPDYNTISQCNVTGMWDVWDEEVEKTCKSYDRKFLVFKNIFCYACNIGYSDFSPLVHTCTNHNDTAVESECLNGPSDSRTFPYWNKYCLECNKIPGFYYWINDDVNEYNINAEYPYKGSIYLNVFICEIIESAAYKYLSLSSLIRSRCPVESISNDIKTSFDQVYSAFLEKKTNFTSDIPLSALYDEYIQSGGTYLWCSEPGESKCSCELDCYVLQNCCPDMLLNDPVECREMDGRNITVITKCPIGYPDKVLAYYCERNEPGEMTVLDSIPSEKLDSINPEFKNIFCKICNMPSNFLSTRRFEFNALRALHLKCKMYIDFDNFLPMQHSFKNLFNFCQIEYKTYYSSIYKNLPSCSISSYEFEERAAKCDMEQFSSGSNYAIQHMCENTGIYIYSNCKRKYVNIFCEMCWLQNNHCNATNRYCDRGFQTHDSHVCELPLTIEDAVEEWDNEQDISFYFDLNIPVIKQDLLSKQQNNSPGSCTELQYNDRIIGMCREIHCSPGKIYAGGDCSNSFLSRTSEIFYGFAAKISLRNVVSPERIYLSDLILEIENALLDPESSFYYTRYRKLSKFVVLNVPCTFEKSLKPIVEFEMFVHIIIRFIDVSREYADRVLVKYLGNRTQSKISIGNFKADFITENDWKAVHLPQLINLIFPAYHCKFISPYRVGHGAHVFMVDKFLLCPQITLNQTEYRILSESYRLQLQHSRELNAHLDYTVGLDGDVNVCLKEYDAIMTLVSRAHKLLHGPFIALTFVVVVLKF